MNGEGVVLGPAAVIDGRDAAAALRALGLGPDWRRVLVAERAFDELAAAERAFTRLQAAAAHWRGEVLRDAASSAGSIGLAPEDQGKSGLAPSRAEWLSTEQAASRLGVSARRVRQLTTEGALTAQVVGGRMFVSARHVEARRQLRGPRRAA